MVTDPLSDFLTRIKNAQAVRKESVMLPYSKFLWETAQILEEKGYIGRIEKRGKRTRRAIEAYLMYHADGRGRISDVRRISKPSQRVYAGFSKMFPVKHGFGARIVSTSRGLMLDRDARKEKIGGEVLFEIW